MRVLISVIVLTAFSGERALPGLDERDVSLTIQNGVLTIEGEKKLEHEEEKDNYHVMERCYGGFQRSLRIPDTVNEEIEAYFDKGVLKVVLPNRWANSGIISITSPAPSGLNGSSETIDHHSDEERGERSELLREAGAG